MIYYPYQAPLVWTLTWTPGHTRYVPQTKSGPIQQTLPESSKAHNKGPIRKPFRCDLIRAVICERFWASAKSHENPKECWRPICKNIPTDRVLLRRFRRIPTSCGCQVPCCRQTHSTLSCFFPQPMTSDPILHGFCKIPTKLSTLNCFQFNTLFLHVM